MSPDQNEIAAPEEPQAETEPPEEPQPDAEAEPETFPRSYVEELRQENGKYRQRAQKADTYAQRLHTELVRATGKLADPTDLPFKRGSSRRPRHVGGRNRRLVAAQATPRVAAADR